MSMSGSSIELPITTDATPEEKGSARKLKKQLRLQEAKTKLSSPWASGIAIALAILWTIPTLGLFITSFRPANDIQSTGWWTVLANPGFTFENYQEAWAGAGGTGLSDFFLNSFVIVLPGVIIPISLALLAAYAFAWIDFKGRDFLFVVVFALQIVPIQVALIPLQTIFVNFGTSIGLVNPKSFLRAGTTSLL